jgi:hypothetical protein
VMTTLQQNRTLTGVVFDMHVLSCQFITNPFKKVS